MIFLCPQENASMFPKLLLHAYHAVLLIQIQRKYIPFYEGHQILIPNYEFRHQPGYHNSATRLELHRPTNETSSLSHYRCLWFYHV
jgi:hypothetical protein